jgi:hypothetical protein
MRDTRRIAAMARRLGASREWAERLAKATGTRQTIPVLVNVRLTRMGELFDEGLTDRALAEVGLRDRAAPRQRACGVRSWTTPS